VPSKSLLWEMLVPSIIKPFKYKRSRLTEWLTALFNAAVIPIANQNIAKKLFVFVL
jgi:hypothetical protein